MEDKFIKKVLRDIELTDIAREVITVILKNNMKLNQITDVKALTSLGPVLFRRAIQQLVDLGILVWIRQLTCSGEIRHKGMLYGPTLLNMGVRQIVKQYNSLDNPNEVVKPIKEKDILRKNTAVVIEPNRAGRGYKDPHKVAPTLKENAHKIYYVTDQPDLKEKFLNKMKTTNKIPTAHLQRKANAIFKDPGK